MVDSFKLGVRKGVEKAAELGKQALLVSYREPGALQPLLGRIKGLLEQAGLTVVEFHAFDENPAIETAAKGRVTIH